MNKESKVCKVYKVESLLNSLFEKGARGILENYLQKMYIFLDESYNLKDRTKPQFISINGFETTTIKQIWKQWRIYRRRFVGKERIHATDRKFEPLREKCFELFYRLPQTTLLTSFQAIQEIPVGKGSFYFRKDKLDFEMVYEDILKSLLDKLNLHEYKEVVINIDDRKHKEGILGKRKFQKNVLSYLNQYYPNTIFRFQILPSSSNVLIEVADFVSNTFYKKYVGQKIGFLDKLEAKTIEIKNPLGEPRG